MNAPAAILITLCRKDCFATRRHQERKSGILSASPAWPYLTLSDAIRGPLPLFWHPDRNLEEAIIPLVAFHDRRPLLRRIVKRPFAEHGAAFTHWPFLVLRQFRPAALNEETIQSKFGIDFVFRYPEITQCSFRLAAILIHPPLILGLNF